MRRFLAFYAVVLGLALSMILFQIWFSAYVAGGTTTVYVDAFGEAHVELVALTLVWAVLPVGTYYALERVLSDP